MQGSKPPVTGGELDNMDYIVRISGAGFRSCISVIGASHADTLASCLGRSWVMKPCSCLLNWVGKDLLCEGQGNSSAMCDMLPELMQQSYDGLALSAPFSILPLPRLFGCLSPSLLPGPVGLATMLPKPLGKFTLLCLFLPIWRCRRSL